MKKTVLLLIMGIVFSISTMPQGYNQEKIALTHFLVRMYQAEPFEGVKVVSDYDDDYLLSVVLVNASSNTVAMNRIAQVKSQRQVSQFIGGLVRMDSETIIRTTENTESSKTLEEVTDIIKEQSIGFTKAMEVLTTIDLPDNQKCYMFYRKLQEKENDGDN